MGLITAYQRRWPKDFAKIKTILSDQLMDFKIRIEHIGSTAVPKLPAKDIIDIDIVFYSDEDFEPIKDSLTRLGYFHNGNQGINGREVFKRKGDSHIVLDSIPHHLYVCHFDNTELKRHLLFKQHLMSSKSAREAYAEMKLELAEQADQDKKTYALLKEEKARDLINNCIKEEEKKHEE